MRRWLMPATSALAFHVAIALAPLPRDRRAPVRSTPIVTIELEQEPRTEPQPSQPVSAETSAITDSAEPPAASSAPRPRTLRRLTPDTRSTRLASPSAPARAGSMTRAAIQYDADAEAEAETTSSAAAPGTSPGLGVALAPAGPVLTPTLPAAAGAPFDANGFAARVRSLAETYKRYPARALRLRQQGVAVVSIVIKPGRCGDCARARLRRSSGSDLLDEEAVRMVRTALARLGTGRLPPRHNTDALRIDVPISFRLGDRRDLEHPD